MSGKHHIIYLLISCLVLGTLGTTPYQVTSFDQIVDHFSNETSLHDQKWSQKVLIDNSSWLGAEKQGPIIFLAGCEADIESLYLGQGFFNQVIKPEIGAFAIYAEHRYFGASMPFGADSFNLDNLKFLTADQTIEDFAAIIKHYKNEVLNCTDCPVITFGGSYCGQLAAWLRMRYPALVDAAVTSSASLRTYSEVVDTEAFYASSTNAFNQTNTHDSANIIKEGFTRLKNYSQSSSSAYQDLNQYLNLCHPMTTSDDINKLSNWMKHSFVTGSMFNNYLTSGSYAGKRLLEVATLYFANLNVTSSDHDIFLAMRNSAMICQKKDPKTCLNLFSASQKSKSDPVVQTSVPSSSAFDVLTCNDLPESMGPDGIHDMYPAAPWNKLDKAAYCLKYYRLVPKFDWVMNTFGGWTLGDYASYSNIFFANGKNDPWFAAGVTQNVTNSVVAYIVEDGTHCQDLSYNLPYDSDSLKFVRAKEKEFISSLIQEKKTKIEKIIN